MSMQSERTEVYLIDKAEHVRALAYVSYVHSQSFVGYVAEVIPALKEEQQRMVLRRGGATLTKESEDSTTLLIAPNRKDNFVDSITEGTYATRMGRGVLSLLFDQKAGASYIDNYRP